MAADVRWLGHSAFHLSGAGADVLVDPFLTGNPKAVVEASEVEPTHIFLTHGHADHFGDVVDIAKRTGAQVLAIVEIANELGDHGVENVSDPNIGGTIDYGDGLWARLVAAWHTSTTPGGTVNIPAGLVIGLGGKVVYHLGDTALFSDLRLVGERDRIDAALMCIGGHYTMDRHDAVVAAELIGARTVIPCHYDTFPPIETDAQAFKADVEARTGREGRVQSTVEVLEPGQSVTI
jgi:L-ascorbate metabolism protein UlaG (beta-lactamase superfamily)